MIPPYVIAVAEVDERCDCGEKAPVVFAGDNRRVRGYCATPKEMNQYLAIRGLRPN